MRGGRMNVGLTARAADCGPDCADIAEEAARSDAASPCAEEFAQISVSLQHREGLLAASARASRMLLEATDVMNAIPAVLRELGAAAGADRVNLIRAETGPDGKPWMVVAGEWTAAGISAYLGNPNKGGCPENTIFATCKELRAGRSVLMNPAQHGAADASAAERSTLTKAVVPIFVDNGFFGALSFDNTRQRRAIDPAEVAALETAAGVIGAGLHRERLIEVVRREREQAADLRMNELAKANAVIRGNLERLATEPDARNFLGHVLLEATRQFDAAAGNVIVRHDDPAIWEIVAHVDNGVLGPPAFTASIPADGNALGEKLSRTELPMFCNLISDDVATAWPGLQDYQRRAGHTGMVAFPLLFGGRNVGFITLYFKDGEAARLVNSELLVALAQQATLAIEIMRLAHSAKEAAVLVERNRIGREIHDGLAQAFTGILMQLAAAEDFEGAEQCATQGLIADRIRDLAREGLAEARRSVMALRPDQTRSGGLELALRQLAERSSVPGRTQCSFEGRAPATGLAPEHEHALLRIAQEAVSNAVRHGHPQHVRISLIGEAAHWVLTVADDGQGMEGSPEDCAQHGFGLSNMQERATAIGGSWQIETHKGEGTRVSVRLPRRNIP
ncbi:MAG TPA: ATP-binding protein [Steroidobacteraceae bacterium]|nr:ATP-binding protein [Steroidobacteraceae bacterium]